MGQESRHSLAGHSTQGLRRLSSGCLLGLLSCEAWSPLPSGRGYWQSSVPRGGRTPGGGFFLLGQQENISDLRVGPSPSFKGITWLGQAHSGSFKVNGLGTLIIFAKSLCGVRWHNYWGNSPSYSQVPPTHPQGEGVQIKCWNSEWMKWMNSHRWQYSN